jgi:IS5 family transposase
LIWAIGVWTHNPDVHIVHRGKAKRISEQERRELRRRQAIEPIIGHLKADHRMDRCHLKGETGDRLHAVLCAAGYNIRWLLRMIARKGIIFLQSLYLRLCSVASLSLKWQHALDSWSTRALTRPAQRPVWDRI